MSETSGEAEQIHAPKETPPSLAVIQTVADAEGVDPLALTPPLSGAIDPDALDALVGRCETNADVTVRFSYCGYEVVADAGDGVTLAGGRD